MSDEQSVWFPTGDGPLLEAAEPTLAKLRESSGVGPYRIGDQRRDEDGKRTIEIIFESAEAAVMGKLTAG